MTVSQTQLSVDPNRNPVAQNVFELFGRGVYDEKCYGLTPSTSKVAFDEDSLASLRLVVIRDAIRHFEFHLFVEWYVFEWQLRT